MSAENRWSNLSIWALASALGALACSMQLSSARLGSEYLPFGNDSFYHARRILDAIRDPWAYYQFDPYIHAPEGSLLTWPWAYDYLIAWIARIAMALGLSTDPMAILAWIPVAAVPVTVALLIAVAKQLQLSNGTTVLAGLCFALTPTTQTLHGVGQLDHHYAELMFVLATLATGLHWLRNPERPAAAALVAAVLGIAPAIHNGLFVLQVPLLVTIGAFWRQGKSVPARTGIVFGAVLTATTLAMLIPSLPFRLGRFEFYTHSWFHLYIAACTSTVVVFTSRIRPTRVSLGALGALAVALLIPIATQIEHGQSFVTGSIEQLGAIGEVRSPLQSMSQYGADLLSRYYSLLIWGWPLTIALCLVQCWRERTRMRLLFWVTSLTGLLLLSMQMRLHYFGDFALYLPWLVLAEDFLLKRSELRKTVLLIVTLVLLLLYIPPLRYQLVAPQPLANDLSFSELRPLLGTLQKACGEDPGIVLADSDAGHYVRYYTDCSVIANNFIMTPQHMTKLDEMVRLNSLTPAQLVAEAPHVKYVLVRPLRIKPVPDSDPPKLAYHWFFNDARLAKSLLLGELRPAPSTYVLLHEVRFPPPENTLYARLYKITGARAPAATGE